VSIENNLDNKNIKKFNLIIDQKYITIKNLIIKVKLDKPMINKFLPDLVDDIVLQALKHQ